MVTGEIGGYGPATMRSRWNDEDARAAVACHGPEHGEDLAVRVYTSRLFGADPGLVLHGGGNTSVKTTVRSLFDEPLDVLCVKGSGWDLATIEPRGMPALEFEPLRRLRELDALSDAEVVNQTRARMVDSTAPNPSIETLLHAFLPHKFVDHTHADAILELTNQPDGAALLREALGPKVVVLPWIMPGFPLAKAVMEACEAQPDCEGIVLSMHGIFTFDDDARQSYERMVELVDRAERFVDARIGGPAPMLVVSGDDVDEAAAVAAAEVLPVVRGALSHAFEGALGPTRRRLVAEWRGTGELCAFTRHPDCAEVVGRGPLTPDHVIRTKGHYLFLNRKQAADPAACREAVAAFVADYERGFAEHAHLVAGDPVMADPEPRVVLVEGVGVLAFGADKRAARVTGDIAVQTLRSIARARAVGDYRPLPPARLFEIEYWGMELAKLEGPPPAPLAGQVGVVTGAAGAIGCGIADALLAAGCHVVITDLGADRLATAEAKLLERHRRDRLVAVTADHTRVEDVERLFRTCRLEFGGVDIVVPNAGIAHVSTLAEMDIEAFRRVLDVNATGTMLVLREAARLFAEQGTGGSVVVQSSKNVFDPGAGFGAYSASKAATHQLGKIAALEMAPLGVRVNLVNADAVFGDDEVPSGLWAEVGPDRMRARGLDPEGLRRFYRDRSLLKTSVLPAHVGQAVVFFASERTPTTGATLPVDGGVAGAFPR